MSYSKKLPVKRFYTKYDVPSFGGCVMNPFDAVDRLSYVDTTTQIVRMLQAGADLKLKRNQGFSDEDFNAPSMQVYPPDIADSQRRLNEFQQKLKDSAKAKSEAFEKERIKANVDKNDSKEPDGSSSNP